jgi:hypothetical protein
MTTRRTNTPQLRTAQRIIGRPFPPAPDPGPRPGPVEPAPATARRVRLVLERLYCAETTEAGHDEVYFVLGGVDGAGKQIHHRGPDAFQSGDADNQTAWDMNDSGSQQNRLINADLCNEALAPGQTATFGIGFLESDGQDWGATVKAAIDIGSKVASLTGAGAGVGIAGQIASWLTGFIPKNQDDALGAFSLQVSNDNGKVVVDDLVAGAYTTVHSLDRTHGTFNLRFQHDDGNYTAYFRIRGA